MGQSESSQFPFHIGEEVVVHNWTGSTYWKLFKGKAKDDGSAVSIFSFDKTTNDATRLTAAQNALQRLRTTRHPNILRFINGVELSNFIYIVTESVEPLNLKSPEFTGDASLVLGLRQCVHAVAFLSNDCKLVHGNVCPTSIFVTPAGDWKLGGFDVAYPHSEEVPQNTRQNADILPNQYRSPELGKRNWSLIQRSPVWATDAWSLACLMYEIFNKDFTKQQQLGSTQNIPRSLVESYGKLLANDPGTRLNPSSVLKSKFFDTVLVKSVEFLENLPIKTEDEKQMFFSQFADRTDDFPEKILKYRILPELIKSLEYGAAVTSFSTVWNSVLNISSSFSDDEFNSIILPSIIKLYSSNERTVRLYLLQTVDKYAEHLSPSTVNDVIWPNVVSGFTDATPVLREATLKSVPHFIPKLAPKTVDTQLMQFLAKLQTDAEASIRTNTTYCLGQIARHLSNETRAKVLASAFCRALRDPFPPSRIAGLAALSACVDYFTQEECSKRIIPTISPFSMDSVKEVREICLKCLSNFVLRLQKLSEQMMTLPPPGATANPSSNGPNTTGMIPAGAASAASSAAGVLGKVGMWAVSSVANKLYGASDGESKTSERDVPAGNATTANAPAISKGAATVKTGGTGSKPTTTNNGVASVPKRSATGSNAVPRSAGSSTSARTASPEPTMDKAQKWDDDFFDDFAGDEKADDRVISLSTSKPKTSDGKPDNAKQRTQSGTAGSKSVVNGAGGGKSSVSRSAKTNAASTVANKGDSSSSLDDVASSSGDVFSRLDKLMAEDSDSLVPSARASNHQSVGDWDSWDGLTGKDPGSSERPGRSSPAVSPDADDDDIWGSALASSTSQTSANVRKTPSVSTPQQRTPSIDVTSHAQSRTQDPFADLLNDSVASGTKPVPSTRVAAAVAKRPSSTDVNKNVSSMGATNASVSKPAAAKNIPNPTKAKPSDWADFLNN